MENETLEARTETTAISTDKRDLNFDPQYTLQEEYLDAMRCRCACAPSPGPYCR